MNLAKYVRKKKIALTSLFSVFVLLSWSAWLLVAHERVQNRENPFAIIEMKIT